MSAEFTPQANDLVTAGRFTAFFDFRPNCDRVFNGLCRHCPNGAGGTAKFDSRHRSTTASLMLSASDSHGPCKAIVRVRLLRGCWMDFRIRRPAHPSWRRALDRSAWSSRCCRDRFLCSSSASLPEIRTTPHDTFGQPASFLTKIPWLHATSVAGPRRGASTGSSLLLFERLVNLPAAQFARLRFGEDDRWRPLHRFPNANHSRGERQSWKTVS